MAKANESETGGILRNGSEISQGFTFVVSSTGTPLLNNTPNCKTMGLRNIYLGIQCFEPKT